MKRLTKFTIFGIPVIADDSIPPTQLILRQKSNLLPDNWIEMTEEEREDWIFHNLDKVKEIEK